MSRQLTYLEGIITVCETEKEAVELLSVTKFPHNVLKSSVDIDASRRHLNPSLEVSKSQLQVKMSH